MKRFYLCLALFAGIIVMCSISLNTTKNIKEYMVEEIDAITAHVLSGEWEEARVKTAALESYWGEHTGTIIKFVRHTDIDHITETIEKLPFLLAFDEIGHFMAELHFLKSSLEHIYEFELPLPSSFL